MHGLGRKTAIMAATVALVAPLTTTVLAEDAPARGDQAKPLVLVPDNQGAPASAATPAPASPASVEDNPCFTGKGSIKDVLDACAAFIASGSTDTEKIMAAHGNRAIGLSAVKDFDGAVNEMNEALRLDPKEPNLYFMRSAAYRAKRDFDNATADIDQAISLDAARGDFYMLRGMIFGDKGDLDRAITELNQKVKLDPNSAPGYSKRAELYRQKKDYDSAVADYTEVIKRTPDDAKAYVDRGWIYVLKKDLDRAMDDFAKALTIHENDASALVGRGLVKSRKGQPTDGSADITLAIKLEPDILSEIKKLGVE